MEISEYKRVLNMVLEESIWGPLKDRFDQLSSEVLIPSIHYFQNIQIADDSWYSFYIGLGLGGFTLAFLILNPGEPYDYENNKAIEADTQTTTTTTTIKKKKKDKKKQNKEENTENEQNRIKTQDTEKKSNIKLKEKTIVKAEEEEEVQLSNVDAKGTSFLKGLMKISQNVSESNAKAVNEATSLLLGANQDENSSNKKTKKQKSKNKEKNQNENSQNIEKEEDEEVEDEDDSVPRDPFADPNIKRKARKAAKLFGLSESQFEEAISNAKIEFDTGVAPPTQYDSILSIASLINIGILLGVLVGCIWALNKDYDNAATKVFVANFPREAKLLGFKWPGGVSPMNSIFDSRETITEIE